jgi:2OG-Fe(II) oxygenase superfamily
MRQRASSTIGDPPIRDVEPGGGDGDLLDRISQRLSDLRETYSVAEPFPHVVIDDVLPGDVFDAAVSEFPEPADPSWRGYLHYNETKYANPRSNTWGPTLQQIAAVLCTDEFCTQLGKLTGFEKLFADPTMDGGGLHQTLRGGYLNIHADFTAHHYIENWQRRVNILIYLNPSWSAEWGGSLELWDGDVSSRVKSIEPVGNRMVIFTTSNQAYHGHPQPLRCPEGMARRSLALYYFTKEVDPPRQPTDYRARPGEGIKGLAIRLDRYALSIYDAAKTRLGLSDRFASDTLRRLHDAVQRMRRTR